MYIIHFYFNYNNNNIFKINKTEKDIINSNFIIRIFFLFNIQLN